MFRKINSLILCFVLLFLLQVQSKSMAHSGNNSWAIKGKAVTDNGIKEGWLVIENGVISKIGVEESQVPEGINKILWNQYIFPGLIDTHNHAKWNSIPQWTRGPFVNRYQWRDNPDYLKEVDQKYKDFGKIVKADSLKYAEVRALIGGTTLIQGSYYVNQPEFLCKNLDLKYKAANRVGNIAEEDSREASHLKGLQTKSLNRLFVHLAEGLSSDPVSKGEFDILAKKGFERQGVVIIHGLGLDSSHFKRMKKSNMHLVWSPVSNWNLYRGITDIKAALNEDVLIALAPDWTVSGSDNVLEEMKFAYAIGKARWGELITPKLLFNMVTKNASKISGVDKESVCYGNPMGEIKLGYAADIFLAPELDSKKNNPYESLLRTYPKHIHLVFVDGKPLYGDRQIMNKLVGEIDFFDVQNKPKAVVKINPEGIYHKLQFSLEEVAPLIEN